MKFGCYLLLVVGSLLLSPGFSEATPQEPGTTIEGLVVGISEGDHITVNSFGTEINVRLYGIAAPQLAKIDKITGRTKAGQPYAEEAFRALSIKILHQNVKVDIRRTVASRKGGDQVALAIVYLDGQNINLEMVSEGWAWAYRQFASSSEMIPYLAAERRARARHIGLWSQPHPQPPWEFHPKIMMPRQHGVISQ